MNKHTSASNLSQPLGGDGLLKLMPAALFSKINKIILNFSKVFKNNRGHGSILWRKTSVIDTIIFVEFGYIRSVKIFA